MKMLTEDISFLREFCVNNANEVNLKTEAFSRMHKPRVLHVNYVQLTGGYKDFPKSLRCLCWHGFPLRSLPSQLPLESLVAVDTRDSNIEQLWQGNKFLGLLKFLNLSHCHCLVKTPDFSKFPALEKLNLKDCVNLIEIDESIGITRGLLFLNLRDCRSLKKLPRNIGMLKFLEILIISGCSNLVMFPAEEMKKLESLKAFYADGISLKPKQNPELPWTSLPQSLVSLSLVGCNLSDVAFCKDFCNVSSLKYLNLSQNPIRFLPYCFKGLTSLQYLRFFNGTRLQSLAGLPSLESLDVLDCPLLENINFLPNSTLKAFVFPWRCEKLVEFGNHFKLESVESIDTEILNSLGYDLESLKHIRLKLYNIFTRAEIKGPIKGAYENYSGKLFSIFIPGSRVPSWFTSTSTESSSSVSFTVPSSPHPARFQCLNVCFVYKIVRQLELKSYGYLCIVVHNLSKDMKIIYGPSCYGIPEADEYMIWLTQ